MNSGEQNQNNFKHPTLATVATTGNSKNGYINTSIDEIEQMMKNQRISDYTHTDSTTNRFHLNQPAMHFASQQQQLYRPTFVQPNHHFRTNSSMNSDMSNVLKFSQSHQPNLVYPMSHINQINHQVPNMQTNQMSHQSIRPNIIYNQFAPKFNVPTNRTLIDPSLYANLNALANHQSNVSQSINNRPIIASSPVSTNQLNTNYRTLKPPPPPPINPDLISPNITGLPEIQMTRKTLPSSSHPDNIYANTSIVSRYVPRPPANAENSVDNYSNYSSTSTLNTIRENETKYGATSINNESSSLYDPVYFRTNSRLSFDSTKDDYIHTSPSSVQSVAGSRQPINALLNNCLDPVYDQSLMNKSYDKSIGQTECESTIDHLEKEQEVDYLTDLLVQGMQNSAEVEFFGMCNKCGKTIYGEENGCVTALGQLFHLECFSCHVCDKTLRDKALYLMDSNPYCENCYLNKLDKCFVCSEPILDRILRALGNLYHPNCFCCVVCGKCLDGVHFTVDHKNKLHCIEDFHDFFLCGTFK